MSISINPSVHYSPIVSPMVGAGNNIHSLDQRIRRLLQSWCLGVEPPQWVWKRIKAELIGKGKTVLTKQIQGE